MPPVYAPEMPASTDLLALLNGDPGDLAVALSTIRAADVADALRVMPPEQGARVMAALPFTLAVDVFDEPELEGHRCGIIEHMGDVNAAPLIEAMSSDQRADLFRELGEKDRPRFLRPLTQATRESLELLLRYPPKTAGGIMTTEFVSLPTTWTVQQALEHIRSVARTKETVYAVYLLNPDTRQLVQAIALTDLMLADSSALVTTVRTKRKPLTVTPLTTREDAARLISKYNVLAVPVVDEGGHVLGIVTVDDVIDAIVREQTEDVQKFGGMEALDEPYTGISFGRMIKKRAGWLSALFLGEMLTATAMAHFEGEIAKAVVLSLFIPLIISSGGNSGSQATSLIIRALALREITLKDWWRIGLRELPTGLMLGFILGTIGIIRIVIWQKFGWYDYGTHWTLVAATIGGALLGVVTFGSLAGSMLPFLLKRLGFDPASASAPFVATLVDVTGLIIYFTVAFAILRNTLLK